MARRAKVPIDRNHVSRAIQALGGRGTLLEITRYIWCHYPSLLVRPEDPNASYSAFQVLKDRVSKVLGIGKERFFRSVAGKWEEI